MKHAWALGVACALVVSLPTGAKAQGDPEAGEKVFNKCKACHTTEEGKNRVGPSLANVVGRKSGSVEGFKYSDAMKNANIEWTPENLDKYLTDPKAMVPGNKMVFAGLPDAKDRQNVIAYLEKHSKEKASSLFDWLVGRAQAGVPPSAE